MQKTTRISRLQQAVLACALLAASYGVFAQGTASQPVNWELQVIRDGQQIDTFSATTNVGQAKTDTHHKIVQNHVGCADQPASNIDLQRTISVSPSVSPTHASADDITLAINAQETLQDDATRTLPSGCKVSPPTPWSGQRIASRGSCSANGRNGRSSTATRRLRIGCTQTSLPRCRPSELDSEATTRKHK